MNLRKSCKEVKHCLTKKCSADYEIDIIESKVGFP